MNEVNNETARQEPQRPGQRLLTLGQAATYLGVGRTTIFQLLGRGDLQAVKIGRCTRLRPEDLEEFISLRLSVKSDGRWTKIGRKHTK